MPKVTKWHRCLLSSICAYFCHQPPRNSHPCHILSTMRYNHAQKKRLILYTTIIGMLILCCAFGYSRYSRPSRQPAPNTSTLESLKPKTEDDTTFLICTPKVRDIYTRWQAIKALTWEKKYGFLFQPHYLYQKGHYIPALALSTFNVVVLPCFFLLILYVFCFAEPWFPTFNVVVLPYLFSSILSGFCFGWLPVVPSPGIIAFSLLITYTIYLSAYYLCERFIGEEELMYATYPQAACEEIAALLKATAGLLKQQKLTPLDETSVNAIEMEKQKQALLSAKEAYNSAISDKISLITQHEKEKELHALLQRWTVNYAPHYENKLLLGLFKEIDEKETTRQKEFNCAKSA